MKTETMNPKITYLLELWTSEGKETTTTYDKQNAHVLYRIYDNSKKYLIVNLYEVQTTQLK